MDRAESSELIVRPNGDVILDEVASGQLDIGEVSLVSALLSARRGRKFKIISGWGVFNDEGSGLTAIYGPDLDSFADLGLLREKRIGLNGFGTISEFLVRRAFQGAGQLPQLVSLRPESFQFALEQQVVEAVAATAPWLTSVRDTPGLHEIFSLSPYLPSGPLFALVASEETIRSRRPAIEEFLRSCRWGWEEARSNLDLSNRLLHESFGIRSNGPSGFFDLRPCETVNVEEIESLYGLLLQVGMITESREFNCSDLLSLLT
jgi:ABC-type nitrate/sulfonate/bicarbonate transport system substrate-binding protein